MPFRSWRWSSPSPVFGTAIDGFFKPESLSGSTRQLGEFSIVVTGLTIVMLGGGIDLSVGSIFALAAFAAVSSLFIFDLPVWVALLAAVAVGGAFGALNGFLIGYVRLRAFLTTLVTFIIGRAVYDILVVNFASKVQLSDVTSDTWDFIGDGTVFGVAISVMVAVIIAIIAHIAPDALAAGLAYPGGRRIAPLGPQCRHPGAARRSS